MELKICGVILAILVAVTAAAYENPADQDPSIAQFVYYRNSHPEPVGIMTTSSGAPISYNETTVLNKPLIHSAYFMDMAMSLNRERMPERVVHAKAAGAYGYFEVTHDLSDICKAEVFDKVGKRTPVVSRFSPTHEFKGGIDTSRDPRGLSVKFYTKEGNFDLVCFHTPMYLYKDPTFFPLVVRLSQPNPVTNTKDSNLFWDITTQRKEGAFVTTYLFGDKGIPDGYRHMPGFSIHTYQVSNKHGERYFVRFHFKPDAGERYLNATEAKTITRDDRDYAMRDLYTAIAEGNYPSWTLYVQALSEEDRKNADFDIFDVTKILPEDKYPLRKVGKLVLDQNPKNHFAAVELAAYCVGNLVPGIQGGLDKLFEGRRFVYRDAQNKRLGSGHHNIAVNKPYRAKALTYNRDGVSPIGNNYGDMPSYYPNGFNGPQPYKESNHVERLNIVEDPTPNNFDQARDFYLKMTRGEKDRLIENIVETLASTPKEMQERVIEFFSLAHENIGKELRKALKKHNKDSCKKQ